MPNPLIDLRDVSRVYRRGADEVHALEHVSLTIESGLFVALMGPSGSGKSTLLNLLSGIDRPSGGDVVVAGRRLNDLSEDELARWRSRHVGLIFQFYNLIPVLSALENVELPLLLTNLDRRERLQRARTALDVVGLAARARHVPTELSGGEQQRVAIARAIVTDPDLIIADEPTGDLDAKNADEILRMLLELSHELRKTVVMVTHDPRASEWVDLVFHLEKGVLKETFAGQAGRMHVAAPSPPRNAETSA
jgi:putative ABC transport system ATP-binding protein